MRKICFIIFSIILVNSSFAQDDLLLEINSIENGLIKNIQIKGDSLQRFNILDRMKYYNVPGVSIAIVQGGKLKWAKGYGFANTRDGKKVDVNTLFQAASISKPIAALSALKLFENDSLELNKDVNLYLKDWKVPENEFTTNEKVTIEKLLTHTAGMTVHGFPGYAQNDSFPKIIDVLNGKGNTAKIFVDTIPGSIWRYSGGGYVVMQKLIEDISGISFDKYMSKNILRPLGMENSTYQQPISKKNNNISAAYDRNGEIVEGLWNNYPEQAAAGLWTTPSDLSKYCIEIQEILNGKKVGILTKGTIEKMLTKYKNDWGLGPSLQFENDSLIFMHGGKNKGFTNELLAYANLGNAVIIMTNADNGRNLISEIKNSISEYYKWSISNIKMIEAIKLSDTILKNYMGRYESKEENLIIEIIIKKDKLFANTPVGELILVPITNSKFIDTESGNYVEFLINKKVTGFIINDSFKMDKI